jgi:ribonuclease VapC
MVIDSSAIIAVILEEPEAAELRTKLESAQTVTIGSTTLVETFIVLARRTRTNPRPLIERFVLDTGATITPFGHVYAEVAQEAFMDYGKGRHPAGLNFGDCMSYAVAKLSGLPLLYVGDDFAGTDVASA